MNNKTNNTTSYVTMSMAIPKIEFWNQSNLTIEEACAYFRIGENTMRRLVTNNPQGKYILRNGNRVLIKKNMFEKYLETINSI